MKFPFVRLFKSPSSGINWETFWCFLRHGYNHWVLLSESYNSDDTRTWRCVKCHKERRARI